jgi:hypothetical protein
MGFFGTISRLLFGNGKKTVSVPKTSKEKGDAFEYYVTGKFDKNHFKLIEMRSDKGEKGNYLKSNTYPDLRYEYGHGQASSSFAVECKWRSRWNKSNDGQEQIEWVSGQKNINNYGEYAEVNNIPVFVIIGIGGEPENPEELFIVPLKRLPRTYAYKHYLYKFSKKDKDTNFFFDSKEILLT